MTIGDAMMPDEADALVTLPLASRMTEASNPDSAEIDIVDTAAVLAIINNEDRKVANAVSEALPAIQMAVEAIVDGWSAGGRLFYIGAGTSGRLGVLDASECPPTFGVSPDLVQGVIAGGDVALRSSVEAAEDSPDAGASEMVRLGVGKSDVVVGLAASGATPYVVGAVREARARGAITVGVCCNHDAPLSRAVDIPIEVIVGPEVVAGSSRMKAGTAQKLVLNMLSTASMIKSGKTYRNLMVDVLPTNRKLRARARDLVARIGHVDPARADAALEASGNRVKPAIVMARLGCSIAEADQHLANAGGVLRRVID